MADETSRSWFNRFPIDGRPWRTALWALSLLVLLAGMLMSRDVVARWWSVLLGQHFLVDAVSVWTHRCTTRRARSVAMLTGTVGLGLILWGVLRLVRDPIDGWVLYFCSSTLAFTLLANWARSFLEEPPVADPDVFS